MKSDRQKITAYELFENLFNSSVLLYDFDPDYNGHIYFVVDGKPYFIYSIQSQTIYYKVRRVQSLLKTKILEEVSDIAIVGSIARVVMRLYGFKNLSVHRI